MIKFKHPVYKIGVIIADSLLFLGPPVEQVVEVGRALRQIGDELDNDENLQRYVD